MKRAVGALFAFGAACVAQAVPVTVDVLVAFDRSAAAWLQAEGRTPAAFAEMAVAQMNEVLPPTELDTAFTFRLAGTCLSAAEAAGADPETRLVNAITSTCDGSRGKPTGAWKDIQAARDACKADVVAVLVDSRRSTGLATGGVSWQLGQGGRSAKISSFAPFAYAACGVEDIEGSCILAHEIGHLMGAGHSDRLEGDPGPQQAAYASAFYGRSDGYGKYCTVMGYPYLTSSDTGYRTVPCFSSATHTWEGLPLGDAKHDNTRTLRETCAEVAKFRVSGNETGGGDDAPVAVFAAKTVVSGALRDADGGLAGVVQLTVSKADKKKVSKVSGTVTGLDGKKRAVVAVKASATAGDAGAEMKDLALSVKGISDRLVVTVGADGSLSGTFGARMVGQAGTIGVAATKRPRFAVQGTFPETLGGLAILNDVTCGDTDYHLVPDGEGVAVDASGAKWAFPKAAGVKYVKDKQTKVPELSVDTGKDGKKTNLCGLKLSVAPKTGVFKGSFTVYAQAGSEAKPKVQKLKFSVTGVMVDGVGRGIATCKKPAASVAVTVE